MFRILYDLLRSSIWKKDLLLHVNHYKTLKNVHMKASLVMGMILIERMASDFLSKLNYKYSTGFGTGFKPVLFFLHSYYFVLSFVIFPGKNPFFCFAMNGVPSCNVLLQSSSFFYEMPSWINDAFCIFIGHCESVLTYVNNLCVQAIT